jgi:hypothetical protein
VAIESLSCFLHVASCWRELVARADYFLNFNTYQEIYIFMIMSRKYKFYNPEGIYFVSFATVYWLDVFVREQYLARFYRKLGILPKQ